MSTLERGEGGKLPKLFNAPSESLNNQTNCITEQVLFKETTSVSSCCSQHMPVDNGHYIHLSLEHQECVWKGVELRPIVPIEMCLEGGSIETYSTY